MCTVRILYHSVARYSSGSISQPTLSSLMSASCCVCLYFFSLFRLNTTSKAHSQSLCIMSLLVSMILLRVSAYEAIIRQYIVLNVIEFIGAAPQLRRIAAGFPPRRPGFKPGSGHVGCCDGQKWCRGKFPLPIYIPSASPQSSSLSPEAGTIGQEWPQCQ
jgi:hypothetical protein